LSESNQSPTQNTTDGSPKCLCILLPNRVAAHKKRPRQSNKTGLWPHPKAPRRSTKSSARLTPGISHHAYCRPAAWGFPGQNVRVRLLTCGRRTDTRVRTPSHRPFQTPPDMLQQHQSSQGIDPTEKTNRSIFSIFTPSPHICKCKSSATVSAECTDPLGRLRLGHGL
jgi:hypothetical protein